MNNLLTGLMGRFTGSDLSNYVGGRIALDQAQQGWEFPYVVFQIVGGTDESTFSNLVEDILIQFSLFSTSQSATEITTMYGYLKSALDDKPLTITGSTCVWLVRQGPPVTMTDEIDLPDGSKMGCKHWAIDYSTMVET